MTAQPAADDAGLRTAGSFAAGSFLGAGVLNLIDAVVAPEGWAWTASRAAVSAVFTVALVVWLGLVVRRWVRGRREVQR